MGCVGRLTWINDYSKKHCRSLFWKTRAAMKRAVKNGSNRRLNFQYDPSSYALNFDDGCCKNQMQFNCSYFIQDCCRSCAKNPTWVLELATPKGKGKGGWLISVPSY